MFGRFEERRPRHGCLVATFFLTPLLSCLAASGAAMIVPPSEVPEALADAAFSREREVARALGLEVRDEQRIETDAPLHTVTFSVEAGECVAVVATAWGYAAVGDLAIRRPPATNLVNHRAPDGMSAHVQWCATRSETLEADIGLDHHDGVLGRADYRSGTIRYAILSGRPAAGMRALNRGGLTTEALSDVDPAVALGVADELASGLTPLGPPLAITAYRARLVPETSATHQSLLLAAQNGTGQALRPHIDLLPPDVPAAWHPSAPPGGTTPLAILDGGSTGTEVPALAMVGASQSVRVLAVLDPAAISPTGCVNVQLVLMRPFTETSARRLGAPSGATSRQQNVAYERVCTPSMYVADRHDGALYQLRIFAG